MARTTVRGSCPLDCPDTCGWLIDVEDGRAVRMRGDREHPFTRGGLCGKVNRYLDALHDPERITTPLVRVGAKGEGRLAPCSWDEAVGRIADGIRGAIDRHGPEAVLPYYFAGTIGQVQAWSLGPRLFAHLGATRLRTTICTAAAQAALRSTYGGAVGPDPEDMAHARLVLLWGSNPLNANLHQWRFVEDARAAGAHVVCIDPIRSDTAARCDEHVAPIPGTDAALALGLMRRLVDLDAVDHAWLDAHTEGWPELERRLEEWSVERAAATCGLDVAQVAALGDRLAATRPTFIRLGLGLQRHAGAGAAVRAVLALPCLTGDFRHVGGGAVSMFDGFVDAALADVVRPAGMPAPRTRAINMSRLGEALTSPLEPPIEAMLVWSSNPAASCPDGRRVRAGLAREDLFLGVIEQRLTDTTAYADVVLPATMQPEHLDIVFPYGHGYVSWNEPAVAPPGECRTTTDAIRAIARALGLEHPRLYDTDEELARQILDTDEARRRGITVEALREHGWVRGPDFAPGTAPFADGGFPTPSGRVRLLAPELEAKGADPLIGYTPTAEVADAALAERFPLVLLAPAGRFFLNSTFGSLPWHRRMQGDGPRVHLHPDDAAARGLADGDRARIWNDRGAFHAGVVVDDAARRGLAFTYKVQWRRLASDGENMNAVTTERDADLGGSPTFHDCRVEVSAAG